MGLLNPLSDLEWAIITLLGLLALAIVIISIVGMYRIYSANPGLADNINNILADTKSILIDILEDIKTTFATLQNTINAIRNCNL